MKKLFILLGMLFFAVSGCTSYHNSVPNNMTQLKMQAKVATSYKILGPTEGKAEAVRVLGFWVGGPAKYADNCNAVTYHGSTGFMGMMMCATAMSGAKYRAEEAAAYNALENFPGADRLIDARWKTKVDDYFIYVKAVSTCKGTAVKIIHR